MKRNILAAEWYKSPPRQSWEKDLKVKYCGCHSCYCYIFHTHWITLNLAGNAFTFGIELLSLLDDICRGRCRKFSLNAEISVKAK